MSATVDLTNPIFTDLDAARAHFEAIRWPDDPYCPYCGQFETVKPLGGKSMGPGWYHCKDCRRKFTAQVGTIYERSHIPMTKWLLATHLMCASKKDISAHQLHRMLGLPYKTAWFMAHRIREGMRELNPAPGSMGGSGKVAEADETFVGGKLRNMHSKKRKAISVGGPYGKETVFSLIERKGRVRSVHTRRALPPRRCVRSLSSQLEGSTKLYTDDAGQYRHMHRDFDHEIVNHGAGEYVRGEAHTNTVESYFAVLKRGIMGTYHHVSAAHLMRYLAEFDFRHNERTALNVTDAERAEKAVAGVVGKRMTYQQTNGGSWAAHASASLSSADDLGAARPAPAGFLFFGRTSLSLSARLRRGVRHSADHLVAPARGFLFAEPIVRFLCHARLLSSQDEYGAPCSQCCNTDAEEPHLKRLTSHRRPSVCHDRNCGL